MYKEITCKSACNKVKRKMPYKYDLNIYRGCKHGCKYCYALYSHKYLESGNSNNYYDDIFVKTNIVSELKKQLSKSSWKKEVIAIGTVTDSYQPIEKEYELMPEILELLIKYKNPIIISTKSNLILRDFDLIEELANFTYVNIASTITTSDEKIAKLLEPGAATVKERFAMLNKFKSTNASVQIHVMPIIPYLTDSYENIDSLFKQTASINLNYVLYGPLNLYGETRQTFFKFLKENFPDFYKDFRKLYSNNPFPNKDYKRELYLKINKILRKYDLSTNYMKAIKEKRKEFASNEKQVSLFDF